MIPETDRIKRKELVETMFRWLVTDLVVPIIQVWGFFFVMAVLLRSDC